MNKVYNFAKWFIGIGDHKTLTLGSRVRTRFGSGVVIGGSVNVLLDNKWRSKNGAMNPGVTVSLEELSKRPN